MIHRCISWKIVIFIAILCLAAFLRLYKLDQIPPGVNRDEASIGYTAYSLIVTGKDEYGRAFPLSFESFGDWKLPLYIYVTIPFVKIFGLTELAVRLPSALAGITTVALTYILAQYLFQSTILSFICMLLLTISPWHLHLSRVESESNLAVLFTVIGLLLFLKGAKKPVFLIGSAVFFALPYFTYHGNHVTTTLFLVGLLYIFRSKIPKKISTLFAGVIFIFLVGCILSQTLTRADKTKISGIGIIGDSAITLGKIDVPRSLHTDPQSWVVKLLHNKTLYVTEIAIQNYLKSFSPDFLFINGGTNHAHNIENFGNLYLVEAPFFYLGIIFLFLKRKDKKWQLILWWLIIAPIAASITKDAPHSNRMFAIYPLPAIIATLGIQELVKRIPHKKLLPAIGIVSIVAAYTLNIGIYLDRYYVHFPQNEERYWGKVYADLYRIVSSPKQAHKQVFMSHPEHSPYIFFLFYSKFDPKTYQATAVRYPPTDDAFVHVKSYDRFMFRPIDWEEDMRRSNILLVDFTSEVPKLINYGNDPREQIVQKNGLPLFTIIENP